MNPGHAKSFACQHSEQNRDIDNIDWLFDSGPASSPVRHIGHSRVGDVELRSVAAALVHHDDLGRQRKSCRIYIGLAPG
jgi:hypothetical protein